MIALRLYRFRRKSEKSDTDLNFNSSQTKLCNIITFQWCAYRAYHVIREFHINTYAENHEIRRNTRGQQTAEYKIQTIIIIIIRQQ